MPMRLLQNFVECIFGAFVERDVNSGLVLILVDGVRVEGAELVNAIDELPHTTTTGTLVSPLAR